MATLLPKHFSTFDKARVLPPLILIENYLKRMYLFELEGVERSEK